MSSKNKYSQTLKSLEIEGLDIKTVCQYYLTKAEEIYKQACFQNNIPALGDVDMTHAPRKATYRYTLEQLKSYNPLRKDKDDDDDDESI